MCIKCISDENVLYSRDNNLKKEDVEPLREWMLKEAHLPTISSNFQIISFLSSCYYRIEPTKLCIENYYTFKSRYPEIFSSRSLKNESLEYQLKTCFGGTLPKLTKNGYQIFYAKLENNSPDKFCFPDIIKMVIMAVVLNNFQYGPQMGHLIVIDGAGLQLGHMVKLTPMILKIFFYFLQEAAPIRLKQIHIINVNPITEKLLNMIKPFLKKELVDQIHCHKKLEDIFKYVEKDVLPSDYGGGVASIKELHEEQIKNIKQHEDVLIKEEELKVDETKRKETPKHFEELFGIVGTFKKLTFD
nr:alpha-tocopherol transfer protein-like isoform X1 [Onthophagus taurus]